MTARRVELTEVEDGLLRAALLPPEQALAAWERVKGQIDAVEALDRAAFRLLPLLYRNLLAAGLDDPVMGRLKGIYRHSWYCNQRLFYEAGAILGQLHAAGIETMVLKGASLSMLCFRDPGARPMEDFDVLVRRRDAERAVRLLEESGWWRVGVTHRDEYDTTPLRKALRRVHSANLADARGRDFDLHWSPLFEPVPESAFWDNAVPVTIGGTETRAPDATNQLLHACVHGLGPAPAATRWIGDVAMAARAEIDWDRLVAVAEDAHLTARLETALDAVQPFGVDVPADVIERLRRARRPLFERLGETAADEARGSDRLVLYWSRYRRLGRAGADGGLVSYMSDSLLLPNRRALVPYLGVQARAFARSRLRRA